ncbi:hypothetical protein BDZ94DRAFT_1255558 [Collybia nuda]|uniref:Uncharacterized protein n=1 Tax=Collybia nuda TaxID=64659 RepID=A0A9P6CLN6_9AGAR|nr:hypothetical protein BDZ94DRAFT_1255558 [Collybia nuda]
MKFSSALASIVLASCFAAVQASENALRARYCLINPDKCVDLNPVPIRECTKLHHQGIVSFFEADVSCVLFAGRDCTGHSRPLIRGEPNHPNFYAGSFLCFPP